MNQLLRHSILDDKNLKKEIHLDEICESLQLDKTRRNRMESAYSSVSSLLEGSKYFQDKDLLIYAYGSEPLGTNTKPYKKDEFDLDFASVISDNIDGLTPDDMLDRIWHVLYNDERYRNKIKKKRYCIRINFAGDFHMDITPCLRIPRSKRLKAADTKLDKFVDRYPKGYIKWFQGLFILDTSRLTLSEYYRLKMELRAETEVLPQSVPYELKQPIQRTVQLIKRARDVYFEETPELATSSVILTTLVGRLYEGEQSILSSISNVMSNIVRLTHRHKYPYILEIYNPADDNLPLAKREKLSNKWNEGEKGKARYEAFIDFVRWFKKLWLLYLNDEIHPERTLKELFGKNPVNAAIVNRGKVVNSLIAGGYIGSDPSINSLTSNSTSKDFKAMIKSTNHGDVF